MSAPPTGKRPLSDIAKEAEANGRASKRKVSSKRASPPPPSSSPSLVRRGETVYKILCPASKTGSIIGKGGSIIKSIRQDTGAMIRIEDAVFGCDERVVTVSAKEEGFRPQKFRGPGNYRKPRGEDQVDYLSDTDEDKEDEAQGQAAEEENATEAQEKATEVEEKATEAAEEGAALAAEEKTMETVEEKTVETEKDKRPGTEEEMVEKKEDGNENGKEEGVKPPANLGSEVKEKGLSPVQEALLRVHLRIIEADPAKPEENIESEGVQEISTRLLVPTSQVGCLLGKQGKIVSQMREESGAQIRVLPKDQAPLCASPADEVVQITGDLTAVKKALLAVSTQLRNNPPKKQGEDSSFAFPKGAHRAEDSSRNVRAKKAALGRPLSPRLAYGQSSGPPLPFGKEDVTFRIMCPKDKIGSIIGKGGSIVQRIREETGAKISIDVSSDVGEERVIRVSAPESPEDVFSKAQKAVMIIHSRILAADQDKDGPVTTKILVPADQAGCLLGKGGSIVIEMRKLTRSKIHIYGKEHLPPCALNTDELVEVVGNFNASQEALMQITTRLRNNLFHMKLGQGFKDTKLPPFSGLASPSEGPLSLRTPVIPPAPAPAPYERYRPPYSDVLTGLKGQQSHGSWAPQVQPVQSYAQDVRGKVFPEYLGIGHTRELVGEPKRPNAAFITSQTVEVVVPEHTISSIVGDSGSNLQQICKISGARVKVNGLTPGALDRIVEISGTPDQTHAAQSLLQAFILSGQ
eukprot:c22156_g1_i1 orf=582-2825(-)